MTTFEYNNLILCLAWDPACSQSCLGFPGYSVDSG
jgi:hypothetical protein